MSVYYSSFPATEMVEILSSLTKFALYPLVQFFLPSPIFLSSVRSNGTNVGLRIHVKQNSARFASTVPLQTCLPCLCFFFFSFQAANKSEALSKDFRGDKGAEDAEAARREISALKVCSTLRRVLIVCTYCT